MVLSAEERCEPGIDTLTDSRFLLRGHGCSSYPSCTDGYLVPTLHNTSRSMNWYGKIIGDYLRVSATAIRPREMSAPR